MVKRITNVKVTMILLVVAGLAAYDVPANAGDLEPMGPPAPTMKTLQQVEPRTPIGQDDVPKTISSSGSYYLTENLIAVGIGPHVIDITRSDVSLDLRGFTIIGSSEVSQADDGIVVSFDVENVAISNGVVRDCVDDGIDAFKARNSQFLNLRLFSNVSEGLVAGNGAVVSQCTAKGNGGGGIAAYEGSTVSKCTAVGNTGTALFDAGIYAAWGSTVTECTARDNEDDGIYVLGGCTVTNCSASANGADGIDGGNIGSSGNTISGCSAYLNTEDGIVAGTGSTVSGCSARSNTMDGISASNSVVRGNSAVANGTNISALSGTTLIENHTSP